MIILQSLVSITNLYTSSIHKRWSSICIPLKNPFAKVIIWWKNDVTLIKMHLLINWMLLKFTFITNKSPREMLYNYIIMSQFLRAYLLSSVKSCWDPTQTNKLSPVDNCSNTQFLKFHRLKTQDEVRMVTTSQHWICFTNGNFGNVSRVTAQIRETKTIRAQQQR